MASYMPTFEFIPVSFFDESDSQWKPSVKVLLDGQLLYWTVYDLGFDEERFVMPYARDFARNEAAHCKKMADKQLAEWAK